MQCMEYAFNTKISVSWPIIEALVSSDLSSNTTFKNVIWQIVALLPNNTTAQDNVVAFCAFSTFMLLLWNTELKLSDCFNRHLGTDIKNGAKFC